MEIPEQTTQTEENVIDRRKVLGRMAAAGAATWAAPAVFRVSAAAAGTPVVVICPTRNPPKFDKPNQLRYEWDASKWEWTTCVPSGQTSVQADGRDIKDDPPLCGKRLSIRAFGDPLESSSPHVTVGDGEQFTLDHLQGNPPVQGGGQAGRPNNNTTIYFACYDPATQTPPLENLTTEAAVSGVAGVRYIEVHTSCSQALCQNDVHGWFILQAAGSVNDPLV